MMKRISMLMAGLLITAGLHADRAADYTNSVAKTGDAYAQGDYHLAGDQGRVYKNESTSKESVTQRQYRAQGSRHQDHEQNIHSARDKRSGNGSSKAMSSKSTSMQKESVTQRQYRAQGSRYEDHQQGIHRAGQKSRGQQNSGKSMNQQPRRGVVKSDGCEEIDGQMSGIRLINSLNNGREVMFSFDGMEEVTVGSQAAGCSSAQAIQGVWIGINKGSRAKILPLTMVSNNNEMPETVHVNETLGSEKAIHVGMQYKGRAMDVWRLDYSENGAPMFVKLEAGELERLEAEHRDRLQKASQ